ncbi:hypothetical protein D2V93_04325 [Flagellimonas taeanensis]|nr:hypothetical protein D2V93_04325 [Allomuricauda taeanensis]
MLGVKMKQDENKKYTFCHRDIPDLDILWRKKSKLKIYRRNQTKLRKWRGVQIEKNQNQLGKQKQLFCHHQFV